MSYTFIPPSSLQEVFRIISQSSLLGLHAVPLILVVTNLIFCSGCGSLPGDLLTREGDEIVISGQFVHTGAPVVLWLDGGGFDGYRAHRHDDPRQIGPRDQPDRISRYGSIRRGIGEQLHQDVVQRGWYLEELGQVIDTIVIHYDACGSSSRCFHILHDIRGLSCHFLLDVDGTIYQTLDVKERAWHAGPANDRSVGIEIAHFGAFSSAEKADTHYIVEKGRPRLNPQSLAGTSAEGALPYPARNPLFEGEIHGQQLYQRDFTEAQYQSLEALLIALCKTLPGIEPVVPRLASGMVQDRLRSEAPGQPVAGIVGHWHVGTHKVDPGPAFDWDRIEAALREADLKPTTDTHID